MQMSARISFALATALLLSGCLAYSEHPVSDPANASIDQTLLGHWRITEEDGEQVDVQVTADSEHQVSIVMVDSLPDGRQNKTQYTGHCSEMSGTRYLNVVQSATGTTLKGYLLVKYDVVNDKELHISLLDEAAVKAAIRNSEIAGMVEVSSEFGDAIISAPASELTAFLTRRDADLFKRTSVLQRQP